MNPDEQQRQDDQSWWQKQNEDEQWIWEQIQKLNQLKNGSTTTTKQPVTEEAT